jgi:GDP-4-dehydro-6-deoxy-D-mannose reductase
VRVLVTGASGFAGGWLVRACAAAGDEVVGVSRSGSVPAGAGARGIAIDLRDAGAVARAVAEAAPDVVYHLAALSHVGRSWEAPAETLDVNALGAVSMLEAVRRKAPRARVVWASSREVYGRAAVMPISEDAPLHAASPYGVSKAAGDMLAGVYADAYGLRIVRARPFNHAGPGQDPTLVLSSLARQGAEARRAGVSRVRVVTGNPDARRDFTDVRDVVRAYRLLAAAGDAAAPPGAVFNIASGQSVSTAEQVATLAELLAPIEVEHVVDPARVRPHELMDHRGSFDRLAQSVGWRPEIPLRQTMADTLAWWEAELARTDGT